MQLLHLTIKAHILPQVDLDLIQREVLFDDVHQRFDMTLVQVVQLQIDAKTTYLSELQSVFDLLQDFLHL